MKILKKILLVDREPRVTSNLRNALAQADKYSIRQEYDAAFAIHIAHWFRPDLIVIDVTRAASDGEIIARHLRSDGDLCHIPLLCLSNFASQRQFVSAGILHGYSFLAMPVKIDQLLRGIEQLLFGKD